MAVMKLPPVNILCYFVIKEVNDDLGIKSTARLKNLHAVSGWT